MNCVSGLPKSNSNWRNRSTIFMRRESRNRSLNAALGRFELKPPKRRKSGKGNFEQTGSRINGNYLSGVKWLGKLPIILSAVIKLPGHFDGFDDVGNHRVGRRAVEFGFGAQG